jgi:hypothetical protein
MFSRDLKVGTKKYVLNRKSSTLVEFDLSRGARVSSISSRGDVLNPNLLYPPLEEKGLLYFRHSHKSYLINAVNFTFAETMQFLLA